MPEIVDKGKGAAEKGKSALGHKVGPLPLWGWVVAGAAAVFVVLKMRGGGGGGSAGAGSFGVASIPSGGGSGGAGSPPIVNPAQNAIGGMDTAPGGTPPWWVSPPKWWNATQSVPLSGQPSTNGSAGDSSPTGVPPVMRLLSPPAVVTAPSDTPVGTNWVTKLSDAVASVRPKFAELVAPTSVSQSSPIYNAVETKSASGIAYDPVFGLYDTAKINSQVPGWTPYNGPPR